MTLDITRSSPAVAVVANTAPRNPARWLTLPLCTLVAIILFAPAGSAGEPTAEDDRARLAGVWEVVKAEERGMKSDCVGQRYEFQGGRLRIILERREATPWRPYELNVAANPRQIDWPVEVCTGEGKLIKQEQMLAIYRFQSDALQIAMPLWSGGLGGSRPTVFRTTAEEDPNKLFQVLTLKRFDPKAKPTPEALARRRENAFYSLDAARRRRDQGKFSVDFGNAPSFSRKVSETAWGNLLDLCDIRDLGFRGCSGVGDAEMAHVAKLAAVEKLDLRFTMVGDAGIARLTGLDNLRELNLCFTPVTDAGLASVAKLKGLQIVALRGTAVSAQGIQKLRDARPGLKIDSGRSYTRAQQQAAAALGRLRFDVDDRLEEETEVCQVTVPFNVQLQVSHGGEDVTKRKPPLGYVEVCDASVVRNLLADLPAPTVIDAPAFLRPGDKDDTIFDCLEDVRGLVRLRTRDAPITDAGLAQLRRHKVLKDLNLSYARYVTDVGLASLQACASLERLDLRGTQCTPAAIASLVGNAHLKELTVSSRKADHNLAVKCAAKGVKLTTWP
jgi:uncharacterized protein (TIGR03067 family)